jgi:hypothetical protein
VLTVGQQLSRHRGIGAQSFEAVTVIGLRRRRGDVHGAEDMLLLEKSRHDVIDGAHTVDKAHIARRGKAHVDDIALRRRDGDVVDPRFALVAAKI